MKTRNDFPTDAAWYAHHRKVLEFAIERKLTPREAEQEMDRIAAREKHRAAMQRLEAKMNGKLAVDASAAALRIRDLPDEPWMMRD